MQGCVLVFQGCGVVYQRCVLVFQACIFLNQCCHFCCYVERWRVCKRWCGSRSRHVVHNVCRPRTCSASLASCVGPLLPLSLREAGFGESPDAADALSPRHRRWSRSRSRCDRAGRGWRSAAGAFGAAARSCTGRLCGVRGVLDRVFYRLQHFWADVVADGETARNF